MAARRLPGPFSGPARFALATFGLLAVGQGTRDILFSHHMSQPLIRRTPSSFALRLAICERIRTATRGGAAFWYDASDDGVLADLVSTHCPPIEAYAALNLGTPLVGGAAFSRAPGAISGRRGRWKIDTVPAPQRQRFRGLYDDFESPEAFHQLDVYKLFYEPLGISDQLRMLPFHEDNSLGWIGAVRLDGTRFDDADRSAANAIADEIEAALAAADDYESFRYGSGHLVVQVDGQIERGCEGALAWCHNERRVVLSAVVAEAAGAAGEANDAVPDCRIDGAHLSFVTLRGDDGIRYLVNLSSKGAQARPLLLPLTSIELEVARAAARGSSLPAIAKAHNVSINTVKAQLKSVYKKLNVSSRLELAAVIDR